MAGLDVSEAWTRVAQSLRERLGGPAPKAAALSSDHAERLAEIHATAFAKPWSALEFEAFLTNSAIHLEGLFIGRDPQPCGFVVTRCVLDEAEILSVALAPEARGRGHSRLLLVSHLHNLANAGIGVVHLEVEQGNRPALALYRRLGFVQVGHREGYYARPDGTRANALSMSLNLG
jgi:ribosomal-protein-alanine N-acetyltransferase